MADEPKRGAPPTRREQAESFLLANQAAKDSEVAASTGIDKVTVGRARANLISQGLLPESTRKRATPARAKAPARPTGPPPDSLLTDADMRDLELGAMTDEDTRKKILTALRKIAFSPGINTETAMNAMALWVKLKDAAASKELGPGKPLTRADAKERVLSLMKAVGFDLIFECFQELFVPKEATPDEGLVPAEHREAPPGPAGATAAP
jgi:hypothetical protein